MGQERSSRANLLLVGITFKVIVFQYKYHLPDVRLSTFKAFLIFMLIYEIIFKAIHDRILTITYYIDSKSIYSYLSKIREK